MGFVASNFAKIPSQGYDWYVFILEEGWNDQLHLELRENFDNLSTVVGQDVLVVRGSDARPKGFQNEIHNHYALHLRGVDFQRLLSCLMVTNKPPLVDDESSKKLEDAIIMFFPLHDQIRKEGLVVPFLHDLAIAIKNPEAEAALRGLNESVFNEKWSWLSKYFEIKPSFFGVSIKVNEIIDDMFSHPKG